MGRLEADAQESCGIPKLSREMKMAHHRKHVVLTGKNNTQECCEAGVVRHYSRDIRKAGQSSACVTVL